jgi:3-deoxy-D-manno-octulosonic acid kinase
MPPSDAPASRPLAPLSALRDGTAVAWVVAHEAGRLGPALLHGEGTLPEQRAGRGAVLRLPLAGGEAILRRYRRGGALRHLLPEGHLLDNRPRREFLLHRALYAAGLAVPEPLGCMWCRRRGLLTGAIATRALPGDTLLDTLRTPGEGSRALLADCGRAIRHMHDLGVWHADLQGHNILVTPDGPCLIDFDNARRLSALGALPRARNLLRLRRSLAKHGVGEGAFADLLDGYGPLEIPGWLNALYNQKHAVSDWWTGPPPA